MAHPLQHRWHLYVHFPVFGETYSADRAFTSYASFDTVEGFWQHLQHFVLPSAVMTLRDGSRRTVDGRIPEALGLFKDGVTPKWECKRNVEGGHWESRQPFALEDVDMLWTEMAMAMVGEVLEPREDESHLTGFRIVDKSRMGKTQFRVEVWIDTCDTSVTHSVQQRLQGVVEGLPIKWVWKTHAESVEAWKNG